MKLKPPAKKLELDTNPMIQGMEQVVLLFTSENSYEAVWNLSSDAKALLGRFGIVQDDLERIAAECNGRNKTDSKNPVRSIPGRENDVLRTNTHKRGRKAKPQTKATEEAKGDIDHPKEKSNVGRPKGKKHTVPRKTRSEKGKVRVPYIKK